MAKVMISFPDSLLQELDVRAKELDTTRSGLLQRLAERELAASQERRVRARAQASRCASDRGGNAAGLVREQRRAR